MAESTIPVDLFNPQQVFACLGFMELADVLLGEAAAGFESGVIRKAFFRLTASSDTEPVKAVLEYLAHATAMKVDTVRTISDQPRATPPDDLSDAIENDSARGRAKYSSQIPQRWPWMQPAPTLRIRCRCRYGCRLTGRISI